MKGKLTDLPQRYEPGFLQKLDRRRDLTQRLLATFGEIVDDAGGEDAQTRLRLSLCERFVFLEEVIRRWEAEIVTSPAKNEQLVSRWVQATNSLVGLARHIGLERRLHNVVDLKAYVSDARAKKA